MQKILSQGALRNRYVAPYPKYTYCVNCKLQFTHGSGHPLAGNPSLSKYPYCMKCLKQNATDPGFVRWLKNLFHV